MNASSSTIPSGWRAYSGSGCRRSDPHNDASLSKATLPFLVSDLSNRVDLKAMRTYLLIRSQRMLGIWVTNAFNVGLPPFWRLTSSATVGSWSGMKQAR
ncbi:hypothetical protein BQ8794_140057 [Mesorhizobium prunaredense]|uniref:Uncharacterized protein n=1 Tax=Mesorhizobium prunaredense TaxID=1631249 RepID=A0A1R3V1Y3_9HYPH|nr:hypothetical protein BQ8794_140057 [Mesorhizobium prunaredense]